MTYQGVVSWTGGHACGRGMYVKIFRFDERGERERAGSKKRERERERERESE